MRNLPFPLPACDRPATTRIEVYSATNENRYGSLDGSVYACEDHDADAVAAVWSANLTPFRYVMAPGIDRRCGEGHVFPTGKLGGKQ